MQVCQRSGCAAAGVPGLAAGELLPPELLAEAVHPAAASTAQQAVSRVSRAARRSNDSTPPLYWPGGDPLDPPG